MQRARLPYLLVPLAAFLAIVPLLLNGCSCGHDFDFHLLSWMEAGRQFTQGDLHPHWAYTPAWNAGEPRFVFYPPLSWTIGAVLGLIFPWTWTPILYTWLALTAAGLGLYYLAREFTTPTAATLAAVLYTVNPYMLFTAYERTAYGELLAAAWVPLLLHAILRKQVTVPRIAVPIALLWLTNAPAAVMSCYALALLTAIRLPTSSGAPYFAGSSRYAGVVQSATAPAHANTSSTPRQTSLQLALNTIAGTALGLGLAAFYVLPAAYERRYVQIAMAIIPTLRIQDNFLFHHTTDIDHDNVLHTASLIAVVLIVATAIALTTEWRTQRLQAPQTANTRSVLVALATLTITITLLLTPLTTIIWIHAPELAFLQFPWRLLAILATVLALTIALALTRLNLRNTTVTAITLAAAAALIYPAYTVFHQTCDKEDTVEARLALFHSNQGTDPIDEYTPTIADNDSIAQTNPPYWLSQDPKAKGPANAQPGPAPTHLAITPPEPEDIILNLRDYPAWRITLNGEPVTTRTHRNDGLIAFPVPTGPSTIDITYAKTPDQTLGTTISSASVVLLAIAFAYQKKKKL
jgi:hypothetical protein